MKNPVISAVLAISLLVTGLFAAPAKAEPLDLNDVGAAIAFFLIGKAIIDEAGVKPQAPGQSGYKPFPGNGVAKGWPGYARPAAVLPDACRFTVSERYGRYRTVYGSTCLAEFMRLQRPLPRWCEQTVDLPYRRKARVYGADCLYQAGFRPEQSKYTIRK